MSLSAVTTSSPPPAPSLGGLLLLPPLARGLPPPLWRGLVAISCLRKAAAPAGRSRLALRAAATAAASAAARAKVAECAKDATKLPETIFGRN